MSHPNGVVPEGNLLFSSNVRASLRLRSDGLGLFYRMTDEQIIELLSFFDAESLIRLCMTSRVFHIFCTLDFVWRDIVLRECEKTHQTIQFQSTWRKTYYNMRGIEIPQFLNVRVDGMPSGFLFKQWLCGSIRFERDVPNFFKHQDIPIISAAEMTVERFVREFELPNRPVIIRGAVDEWSAMKKWRDDAYLSEICEKVHKTFRATSAAASEAASFTMPQYLQYASIVKEEAPLYLFERDFAVVPEFKTDFEVPVYFRKGLEVCSSSDSNTPTFVHQPDLFSLLGEGKRPDHRWLVIGPAKSGSLFHIDPNMTNAWNVSIRGRKKWIFYPPTRVPPGVQRSEDGADVTVPISTSEWLLTFWSFHLEARHDPDVSQRPLEAIAEEGDLFFVPHGWWHMVVNLDFSLALTQNYVSTSNLSDVLRFLRDKREQVSGVRDRKEAIQPDDLYESFVDVLSSESLQDPKASTHKAIPSTQLQAHIDESFVDFDINRDAVCPTVVTERCFGRAGSENSCVPSRITGSASSASKRASTSVPPSQLLQNHHRRRMMKSRNHYANQAVAPTLADLRNTAKRSRHSALSDPGHDGTDVTNSTDEDEDNSKELKSKRPRSALCAIFDTDSQVAKLNAIINSDDSHSSILPDTGFSFSFF